MVLPDPKLSSMVMAGSRIKIHEHHALFNTFQKAIKRKTRQY